MTSSRRQLRLRAAVSYPSNGEKRRRNNKKRVVVDLLAEKSKRLCPHKAKVTIKRLEDSEINEWRKKTAGEKTSARRQSAEHKAKKQDKKTSVGGQFTCEYCPRSFPRKVSLHNHRLTHLVGKPFKCLHCPKTFRYAARMEKHERTHPRKVYTCFVCRKEFSLASQLDSHEEIHRFE